MKYNILSAQMWPSWVFGSSGFPSDRLPQLTLPSQKGNQWAPIGWGLPGIIIELIVAYQRNATTYHENRRGSQQILGNSGVQAHSFPPSSLDRRSAELIVSPKKVVGCRGGSRNVEGCWGFPYLKIEKFVGFTNCPFHVVR